MAELIGRQASATFAGSETGTIGTTLYGFVTQEDNIMETVRVTRWGDVHHRYVGGLNDGQITLAFTIDSTFTPTIPTGTAAVLVVFLNTTGSKKTTYTNAIVERVTRRTNARGGEQIMEVRFQVTIVSSTTQPAVGS
jgi:hypothetical protein